MDVDIASIEGGEIPVEPIPFFIKTPEDKAFESNNLSVSKLKNSFLHHHHQFMAILVLSLKKKIQD